ncbi:CCA tRNA nucleotidyltransferase [uncultured Roseobacter sp.]|uniref:CCA tRNA nucleotidyltransferase n=1 Tax=uncultured Roseobacter sp. TaxID=114847 RepID=UPI002625B07B|nr:CCA tRNA nucleotidyltransferase [uncultured Roseobacter sp.]
MDRPDLTVIPPQTPWLTDPTVQSVCQAIRAEGAEIYFVGGCVRDALLDLHGSDVDMATNAPPDEVTRLAKANGLKVVPTGIDHGTVTVVSEGTGFEITTFRRDVETDGRRAVVAFSDDILEDASRRDFTLNALYATPEGEVVDPLGQGIEDCLARRIRFIENADARIKEDYLRALRFFRFHAWYADPSKGFDADALDAIARNTAGLETLSAERLGAEMRRLLAAPDPAPAVAAMQQAGALPRVLPGSDITFLGPVIHLEAALSLTPNWRYRLAALGGQDVSDRLRLSGKDTKVLDALRDEIGNATPMLEIGYRQGTEIAFGVLILRAAMANQMLEPAALDPLRSASQAQFPVRAKDLMPAFKGKALGTRLALLERRWVASDFRLTREELMTLK